jgi:rhodanese-related sulfurtransferase
MSRMSRIKHGIKNKSRKTKKAPCEVCSTKRISAKSGLYALKNGDTHLRQYLPAGNELRQNMDASEKIALEGLRPRTTFFYFATNSKDFIEPMKHFKDAYDTLQNSGVARTDANGRAVVRVNCPQIYLAEDGKVYSRHFHIIYWDAKHHAWDSRIYTYQIFCNVDRAFVKAMLGKVIIIDALSPEHYNKNHIPGAINMPASRNWTLEEVMTLLPKGTNSTTPMIIYCYSPECTAAGKLWAKLNRLGFYNTMHYLGGISDWTGTGNK